MRAEEASAISKMSNGNGSFMFASPQSSDPPIPLPVSIVSTGTSFDFGSVPASATAIVNSPAPFYSADMLPMYEQRGSVIVGPGSKKEALLLGLGLPRLSYRQQDDLENAKKFAMEQSIKDVLMKQTLAHQQQQQKLTMYAQALSLMGRVYVGSISFELKEETIKNAFSPFGPLKSVNMSWDPMTGHHKGFAFLEYEVPEAATLAQEQMNGVLMGGRNIKVGRPSNMSQAQPIVEMIKEESVDHHRIYVASIHPDLTEIDVKSVFEAFGNIRSIEFAKGLQPGKHRGYAYIDFDSEQAATDAVTSMNLFDLGGQFLRVGRAITPPSMRNYVPTAGSASLPTASAMAAAAVTAKLQALEATSAVAPLMKPQVVVAIGGTPSPNSAKMGPIFAIPPPGLAVPQLPIRKTSVSPANSAGSNSPALFPNEFQPSTAAAIQQSVVANNAGVLEPVNHSVFEDTHTTNNCIGLPNGDVYTGNGDRNTAMSRVIVLRNMVGPEDVDETLEEEVADECSRYGQVDEVVVHQDPSDGPVQVKIFVKFSSAEGADCARSNLDGRYFNGRQINALFYDQNLFDRKDYSR